jgi:hypothetical protein
MCGVAWCNFSWEAFATLMTALATFIACGGAIIGAYVLGRRQMKIMEHQTTVERLKLRSDTFERRWSIYQTASRWLQEWFQTGTVPKGEIATDYMWAIEQSKFLFRPAVPARLLHWRNTALRIRMLEKRLERVARDRRDEIENELVELSGTIEAAFTEIADLFSEDMHMSDSRAALPPLIKPDTEAD